jgi:hypothetical protein
MSQRRVELPPDKRGARRDGADGAASSLAAVMRLGRGIGNAAMGAFMGSIDAAQKLEIQGSVGRGGKNRPEDVAGVRDRLAALGYPAADGIAELAAAISRYQAEVVGLKHPDGRVDVGGRTVKALAAGEGKPQGVGESVKPAAEEAAPPKGVGEAAKEAGATVATPPGPAATGPRPKLASDSLELLVAKTPNPHVDAAARKLAALEGAFAGSKRHLNEESGAKRDELVKGIEELRGLVDGFEKAGLAPDVAEGIKRGFYHAINRISPYYYQHKNIILEYVEGRGGEKAHKFNTCNITSTAMALEALGKTPGDYKHQHLIPAIAAVFKRDIDVKATDKVGTALTGLRLPDYVAMAAIAREMGFKPGSVEQILAAGNRAFESITNIGFLEKLAEDFGAKASVTWSLKLDPSSKSKATAGDVLRSYGSKHSKAADKRGDLRKLEAERDKELNGKKRAELDKRIGALEAATSKTAMTVGGIEKELPLEAYKRAVLEQVGPKVDAGAQVVVGQFNHFVRLQELDDEFVVKDDPGSWTRSDIRVTWEEARALGLFNKWMIVTG